MRARAGSEVVGDVCTGLGAALMVSLRPRGPTRLAAHATTHLVPALEAGQVPEQWLLWYVFFIPAPLCPQCHCHPDSWQRWLGDGVPCRKVRSQPTFSRPLLWFPVCPRPHAVAPQVPPEARLPCNQLPGSPGPAAPGPAECAQRVPWLPVWLLL